MNDGDASPQAPETRAPQDWRAYLHEYSDLYLRTANQYQQSDITDEQQDTRWMGREPATEDTVAAAEQRLGVRFPPSLRGFLLTSDGWLGSGGGESVYSCEGIQWMRDTDAGVDLVEIYTLVEEDDEYALLVKRALEVASGEDLWLLDPTQVAPSGEWAAYLFHPGDGDLEEFTDFSALFHHSRELMAELSEGAVDDSGAHAPEPASFSTSAAADPQPLAAGLASQETELGHAEDDSAGDHSTEEAGPRLRAPQDWRAYLHEYSDLYLRNANRYQQCDITAEQQDTRWMGREPATEEAVAAAERRLGVQFPPSLRGFLLTSDGWLGTGDFVEAVCSCEELDWMRNSPGGASLLDLYSGEFAGSPNDVEPFSDLFGRALEVASGEDFWLLDPTRPAPDGEWPAYLFAPKYGELEDFTDFGALFHESRALLED